MTDKRKPMSDIDRVIEELNRLQQFRREDEFVDSDELRIDYVLVGKLSDLPDYAQAYIKDLRKKIVDLGGVTDDR